MNRARPARVLSPTFVAAGDLLRRKSMKPLLIIAALALTGVAGIAVAQTVEPSPPPPNEYYEVGTVYVAQDGYVNEPNDMDEVDLRILKNEARRFCGDKPDTQLDLTAWKNYRRCVFVAMGGDPAYAPYHPYNSGPDANDE
jgi:hypothetical protein